MNWFKTSEIAQDLKREARREKKLQAAYSELGVAVAESGTAHGVQALHTAVEVDLITGHHGRDAALMSQEWQAQSNLPGNP